jgi:hypothetical protein
MKDAKLQRTNMENMCTYVQEPGYLSRYRVDNQVSIPGRSNGDILSLHHCGQTGSGAHQASYSIVPGALTPVGKANRA